MSFKTEEEIEEWYAGEKQRLEDAFMKAINRNKDDIPKQREIYDAEMKRVIARYKEEHFRLLEAQRKERAKKSKK